jgi:hypothetical protein
LLNAHSKPPHLSSKQLGFYRLVCVCSTSTELESPLGHAEYFIRIPPWLKQGYKGLEALLFSPLYSNNTATAATALQPISQWSKGDSEMHNRNRAKAPKGSILLAADESNKK